MMGPCSIANAAWRGEVPASLPARGQSVRSLSTRGGDHRPRAPAARSAGSATTPIQTNRESIVAPSRTATGETLSGLLRRHCLDYLAEALGLFVFMLFAGGLTTLVEHPSSPVHKAVDSGLLRRGLIGAGLAVVTAAIIYAPWSQRAGAHINSAVTWSFYRLGKIGLTDALFYTAAQCLGAMLAPFVLALVIGRAFAHPDVMNGATLPKAGGPAAAFAAEFAISFVLMLALLVCINSGKWMQRAGLVAAALIGLYITFESQISGMSLNPARSFGTALNSGNWRGLWIYFTAPPAAMLLAAEAFLLLRRRGLVDSSHSPNRSCIVCDFKDGPHYPKPLGGKS